MQLPSINQILKSRLLLPGLVFFGVNCTYSYMFYQVNSFKMFLVFVGVILISIYNDLVCPKNANRILPWKQIGIVFLPLLATLPGYFWYQGYYNYNFAYELSSNLILIVWIAYLYRSVSNEEDLVPFLVLIGVTIIYVGIWAFLEKIGYHPMKWDSIPPFRVKATFGNINYFAGFLVVLLPLMLILALPEKIQTEKRKIRFSRFNQFFLAVFVIAGISLLLCQTRAALAATIISLIVVITIFTMSMLSSKWKKRMLFSLGILFILLILGAILLFIFADQFQGSRIAKLFTLRGWTGRVVSWQAATESIKASPIIGYGLGSSYNLYFLFTDPDARLFFDQHSYNHVHSEILEYLQESGIVGLVAFSIFWVYIAYILFKTIFSSEENHFFKKLSIGMLGGFVGYHLHSLFSVAPRMMVMKLPLFTLIGLVFIIQNQTRSSQVFDTKKLSQRIIAFLPALVILLYVSAIFIPWIVGQNKFVTLQRERQSLMKVEKLESMVKDYPDVYALDFLSHLQIQYRRTSQLQETVDQIDEVLPNYRELGYTKAILAVMQRDVEKAITVALDYQNSQDRYYKPNIFILMGLAADTNDQELFIAQYQLLVRKLIFETDLFESLNALDVTIPIADIKPPFIVVDKGDTFVFKWNKRLIEKFFQIAKATRQKRSYTTKERNSLISFLAFHFSRHPYFQINVKEQYKVSDKGAIKDTVKQYFGLKQEWQKKLQQLEQKHRMKLIQTPISKRPSLQKKQKKEREMAFKPYQEKIKSYTSYLRERSDWDRFFKKSNFINKYLEEFTSVIYPKKKNKF